MTKIKVAEGTGKRDVAVIRCAVPCRRIGFEMIERLIDLLLLHLDPGINALVFRPVTAFVDEQDGGIDDAVAKRAKHQRLPPLCPFTGKQDRRSRLRIEVFADHRAVVDRGAVIGDQHGDLGKRIGVAAIIGLGRLEIDFAGQPLHVRDQRNLAAKWRSGRSENFHERAPEGLKTGRAPLPGAGSGPDGRLV